MCTARIAMWKKGRRSDAQREDHRNDVCHQQDGAAMRHSSTQKDKLPQNAAAAAKGGAVAAMRRVYQHVRDGCNVYVADVRMRSLDTIGSRKHKHTTLEPCKLRRKGPALEALVNTVPQCHDTAVTRQLPRSKRA